MKHTREFKKSAIQLLLNSNEEIKTLAQDLGMNAKTLYKYDNKLQTYHRTKSNKSTSKESLDEENRRSKTCKTRA